MDEFDMISEDESMDNIYGAEDDDYDLERKLEEINNNVNPSLVEFKEFAIKWVNKCKKHCERAGTKQELDQSERICRLKTLMVEIANIKAKAENGNILKVREESIKALELEVERLSTQLITELVPNHALKTYIATLHEETVALRNAASKDRGGRALPGYIVAQLAEEPELAALCTRGKKLAEENHALRTTVDAMTALLNHNVNGPSS